VLTGIAIVLGLCGVIRSRSATLLATVALAVLLLSHTRTALVALIAGIVCSMLTLVAVRRPVRRAAVVAVVLAALATTVLAPAVRSWYSRGQSSELVGKLNGRTVVWDELVKAPRSRLTEMFGMGLTNKSFNGLPIDNSWLATYQDQGLFGVAICIAIVVSLLLLAATRPRGPSLAIAVFLIVYCTIASFTETGLGDVSPYVLDLTLAAALLAAPGDALVRAAARS
jgi:O-antigen ligase